MPGTVTIHRTYFLEEDISDGDYPRDDTRTEVYDELSARDAVDLIRREGLSFKATGALWAANPDGSRMVNYATGQLVEESAHLAGFPERVERAIIAAVDA